MHELSGSMCQAQGTKQDHGMRITSFGSACALLHRHPLQFSVHLDPLSIKKCADLSCPDLLKCLVPVFRVAARVEVGATGPSKNPWALGQDTLNHLKVCQLRHDLCSALAVSSTNELRSNEFLKPIHYIAVSLSHLLLRESLHFT